MTFAVGALVKARGREWVVLPESEEDLLVLRPLGGTEDEVTGIYLPLETVEAARFDLPDPEKAGDFRYSRLLREAVRLGFRSSAGPFRSFARLAVEPRPYQLVPLLMALKLDPVRLLIADDVGIGKTVEAGLIARELLDRGEIERLAVLCPPQLAEQWQSELKDKFHLEAELVLPSTATRLERNCAIGQSLFELYPIVIISTDFIKSDRHREDFLRACPEFVIVDEAHTCAYSGEGRGGRHQRHQLVKQLAADASRHMVLVTATPHSGDEAAFRSLLGLLRPDFGKLPEDLTGKEHESYRRELAAHFVQRRRGDIHYYLKTDTPFPQREEDDQSYRLSPDYKHLFEKVLRYARETVTEHGVSHQRQRVRWWSALALLRSLGSSPAAAVATLRNRANTAATETIEEADEIGRRTVLDVVDDQGAEGFDLVPGSDFEATEAGPEGEEAKLPETKNRRRLLEMAREAQALMGEKDEKLKKAVKLVRQLVDEGYQPILFCRFIPTAEYVAAALRQGLPKDVEVAAVTGLLPPAEREERVAQLGAAPRRVLVATDCLSEGINLQESFNAVVHYDLSWNPTRHEQREGRVDRYGQPSSKIKVITYYGLDNQIDGIVLDVLIKKHRNIRSSLGISVPVPLDSDRVVEAILEGLVLRGVSPAGGSQLMLPGFEMTQEREGLFKSWEAVADREKRSRTMFAQETIKVDEVARELEAVRASIGSRLEVAEFTRTALQAHGAFVTPLERGGVSVELKSVDVPQALREALGSPPPQSFKARFELPVRQSELYLSRTHPLVEGLAGYVMDTALDSVENGVAKRAGVIRTSAVSRPTTLLLLRFRYHIITRRENEEKPLLAEDCQLAAFAGSPRNPEWLPPDQAEALLDATPEANVAPDQARNFLGRLINDFDAVRPKLDEIAKARGQELLEAHRRVRTASRLKNVSYRVEPQLPPDVLGVYLYLPK